jgi:hypothetical protein
MSKTALCTYPSCTRCLRCERTARERDRDRAELEGMRAFLAAVRAVAVAARDPLTVRMCDEAMAGRYPERRAA